MWRYISFVFPFLFLVSCVSEYREHYFSEYISSSSSHEEEDWGRVSFSGRIFVLPDEQIHQKLIEYIDHAKERVWIEIYTWTDQKLLDAVLQAKKRGIDVRVILEGNVYGTPKINKKIF
jgi:phosphatidylserine/phosphatidylglycerophosphate/cardiolipin synthase-like enzyme